MSPPCESYLSRDDLDQGETFYPLHVRVCAECLLVQLPAYIAPEEIFSHYAYFSSYSDSWVTHASQFVSAAVDRLGLKSDSFVVEVASNDGYLLQHAVARGIRCLGIEPAANVARVAVEKGVPTEVIFLGAESAAKIAAEHGPADLVVANNVFAHVPDIVDFAAGLRAHRDPAPTQACCPSRVRHHLPRALLVSVPADDSARTRDGWTDGGRR
jgi:hypothetical protein